ncbi:PH domain-containing protein DDB_G0287875-like [Penaeus chinensis]|uniref:PH domain-containing protein DDB_G0287875-like n=1 Tax=Penaeus chinensis TaxID=139456 RepID=UPI001FB70E2A|nr:PH domain-containing protein DDB_G0287875-like [Penaeus chinensis]
MSARAGAVVVVLVSAAVLCEAAAFPFSKSKENDPLERVLRMIDTERTRRSDFGDLMMESGEESDQLSRLLFERQFGTEPEFVRQLRHRRHKSKEKRGRSKERKRTSKEKKKKHSKEKKKKKHSKEKRPHSRERYPWHTTSVTMTTPLSTSTSTFESSSLSVSTSTPTPTPIPTTVTTTSPTTTARTSMFTTTPNSFTSTSNDPRFPEGMPGFFPDAETIEPFI